MQGAGVVHGKIEIAHRLHLTQTFNYEQIGASSSFFNRTVVMSDE
jgi:hypothetical protein